MSCYEPRNLGCYKSGTPTAESNLIIPLSICVDELRQGDCLDFYIPCNFCYPQCIGNVQLLINNVLTITLIKVGPVKSDQVHKRTRYRVVIGTEFSTGTVLNNLCPSKFPFPTLSATATATSPIANSVEELNTLKAEVKKS